MSLLEAIHARTAIEDPAVQLNPRIDMLLTHALLAAQECCGPEPLSVDVYERSSYSTCVLFRGPSY